MKKLKSFLMPLLLILFFIWSVGIVAFEWFPYYLIKSMTSNTSDYLRKLNYEVEITDKKGFWHPLNLSESKFEQKSSISQSKTMNNFTLTWSFIEDVNLSRTAGIRLENETIYYINQTDPFILSMFGLTKENAKTTNGGIKSVFEFQGQTLAYITYIKKEKNCATAKVISLNSKEVIFDFGCLDTKDADLNGVGGGHLILNKNEFLLATGTPTVSNVENAINQKAQDDNSYWGKILKFSYINNTYSVSIYSKGHRNPQGMATIGGKIYSVEHGPRGGDEINEIFEGKNYGWPVMSFGSEYNLKQINKSPENIQNYINPLLAFVPSIGVSNINKCPQSYNDYYQPYSCLAVSSMKDGSLIFVVFNENSVMFTERLEFGSRIRRFIIRGDDIIAITDRKKIIVGKITPLEREI